MSDGRTFWTLIADAARREPNRRLLADDHGRSLTTRQLQDAACATAAAFAEGGIGAGTVVSWQLPTTLETMVVMAALARLGAVQNPIIPILREHEVGFITGQLATEFLVVPEFWRGFDHGGLARALSSDKGFGVITVDLTTPPVAGELRLPCASVDALPAPAEPTGDTRWIYYSSGTTAAPKGIRHTDASVIAGSAGVLDMVGASSSDVNPIVFPVAHIGGAAMLAAALLTGMRLVLFEAFDPATTPLSIAAHNPTFLGTATPFFVAYLEAQRAHGDRPLFPSLRACLAGGAPITAELGRQVRETFGVAGIANSWGLTEFPVATSPAFTAAPEVLDYTVGPPVPGVSVRVVDNRENELPAGRKANCGSRDPNASSATPTPHLTPTRSIRAAGCVRAISGWSMRMAMSVSQVVSRMRSSATRRMFRPWRLRMCWPLIPRSLTSPSSECPIPVPASGCAPWWYPLRSMVCHWNPLCSIADCGD